MLSGSKFLCLKISVFKLLPPSNYVLVGSQIWETFYLVLLSFKWIFILNINFWVFGAMTQPEMSKLETTV